MNSKNKIKNKIMELSKRTISFLIILWITLICNNINSTTIGCEITYLQTDREVYIAGETVMFKLYNLDAVTKKRSALSKVGYIIVRAVNSPPSLKARVQIEAGMANGSIVLPDTLTSGMYQIVAYTSAMKNYGEGVFFRKEITIVNRFDKALEFKTTESNSKDSNLLKLPNSGTWMTTDKLTYGRRDKVKVNLRKGNCKGNVSVSVFEKSPLSASKSTIVEALSSTNAVQVKNPQNIYTPESKRKLLRGTVLDANAQQTIKNAIVLLSCTDTIPNLQYAVTNSNGLFELLLSDYYNARELFLTIMNVTENQNWQIKIEDEFNQSEKWNPLLVSDNENYKEFIVKSQNIVYINKSYQLNDKIDRQLFASKPICPQLYHCPVETVFPSNFVSLPNFPELAVEILPQVRIIKEDGKFVARVFIAALKGYAKNSPAVFLDGVFVDDISKIIELGSEQIKRIDVVTAERAFGDLVFSGIISIISTTNEMTNSKPASYSLRLKNDEINIGGKLITISENTIQNMTIPLVKQLLYWNPNLELNGTDDSVFEFYTPDNTGNFIIRVEGLSDNGIPISAESIIQVTNQVNAKVK